MNKNIALFAGPSLNDKSLINKMEDIDFLPPAKAGDLINYYIANNNISTIILADGYFYTQYPPLHREIQLLLKNGVNIIGCSSMGAIRAVELEKCGMKGYGEIFNYYKSLPTTGDDEVGILHSIDNEYNILSIPLINIRIMHKYEKEPTIKYELSKLISYLEKFAFFERTRSRISYYFDTYAGVLNKTRFNEIYVDYKARDLKLLLSEISAIEGSDVKRDLFNDNEYQSQIYSDISLNEANSEYYVLSPFKRLFTTSKNEYVSELSIRDLFILSGVNQCHNDAYLYKSLLLEYGKKLNIVPATKDLKAKYQSIMKLYNFTCEKELAFHLALTPYELHRLTYEECIIECARSKLLAQLNHKIYIGRYLTFLRGNGLWPADKERLIKDFTQLITKIKNFYVNLGPRLFGYFRNNGAFLQSADCLSKESYKKAEFSSNSNNISLNELDDIIARINAN